VSDSRREDILLGLFVLCTVGLLATLSVRVGSMVPEKATRYHFIMDGVLGLQQDNRVTVAGVNVGVVEDIHVQGRQARLTVAVDPDLVLHSGAQAAVRARTLLGEKYVDLDPGDPDRAVIPPGTVIEENVPTVEIDSVIRGAAQLVTTLNAMAPKLRTAAEHLEGVLATADMKQVARDLTGLIKDTDEFILSMQRALGDSSQDARVLLRDLRARTPRILDRMDSTAMRVEELLATIPSDSLRATLKKAPDTLDSTSQTLQDVRLAISDLRNTSVRTAKVLDTLDAVLTRASGVSEKQIRELLQVEGVRVNLITDPEIERRVKALARPNNSP
jgi:phospholipid/cholesterol/gamma-HCH transport system substrate-binding protein